MTLKSICRRLAAVACLLALTGVLYCPQAVAALELRDTIVEGATVWSGEVRIAGVVVVKKDAHLTILPGTRVLFEKMDRDGDGIGDSELFVEGSLIARGTAQQPILFTSAATEPAKADWKYLYLDFAREGIIEHVISEYAYSGIQVHFCKARVLNSEFRYNMDGVRFSTANIEVAGNRIHHNRHGIRFEERRGGGRVHHNQISENDIGIFAVTRCQGRTLFELNNIEKSRAYQVKLGLEQTGDLSFPRNWWGGMTAKELSGSFFDQAYDRQLGRVTAPEPLAGPEVDGALR